MHGKLAPISRRIAAGHILLKIEFEDCFAAGSRRVTVDGVLPHQPGKEIRPSFRPGHSRVEDVTQNMGSPLRVVAGESGGQQVCVFVQDDGVVEFVGIQSAVPQNKRRIRASVEECVADLARLHVAQNPGIGGTPENRELRRAKTGVDAPEQCVSLTDHFQNVEGAGNTLSVSSNQNEWPVGLDISADRIRPAPCRRVVGDNHVAARRPAPYTNGVAPIHRHQGAECPVSVGSDAGNGLARRLVEHIHRDITNGDHHRTLEVQPVSTKIDLFVEGSASNLRR